jgi:hypothetical protein
MAWDVALKKSSQLCQAMSAKEQTRLWQVVRNTNLIPNSSLRFVYSLHRQNLSELAIIRPVYVPDF